ncbi:MAG: DUF1015 domain-containing protein [Bryobacteraceae bacterium]
MAKVFPFHAYRYASQAGTLEDLATQPYDKISPEMQDRYLARSPYNLVRIILGKPQPGDGDRKNVYTRAKAHLDDWIGSGVLAREDDSCVFVYFQEFTLPDGGERLIRKGFIGLGAVEDYRAGIVHRHEKTLSGPKKDRLELLRHTRAHFGQIFMLYPDRERKVDAILDEVAAQAPTASATDEYDTIHTIWRVSDPAIIARIVSAMSDKRLLIADGHHRYETAVAFRDENPGDPAAAKVMMTFVNTYSGGLRILATHRAVSGLANFDGPAALAKAAATFTVEEIDSAETLNTRWAGGAKGLLGAAIGTDLYALTLKKQPDARLDLQILHEDILDPVLGVTPEAINEGKHLRYVRGLNTAIGDARSGVSQIVFLVKATSVDEVADISFGGGVMPQKSTDFYPKLLSGLTIYRLDG